jgi:hypothetical protein
MLGALVLLLFCCIASLNVGLNASVRCGPALCLCLQGALRFADGRVYEGRFEMGQPHGWGQMRYPANPGEFKGDVLYAGNFAAGLFHGDGTLWERWPDGRGSAAGGAFRHPPGVVVYRGPFARGARHGPRGVEDYPGTGERYEGPFALNAQCGHGVLYYAEGARAGSVGGPPLPPLDPGPALAAVAAAQTRAHALAHQLADAADPAAAALRDAGRAVADAQAAKADARLRSFGRARSVSPTHRKDSSSSRPGSKKKGHGQDGGSSEGSEAAPLLLPRVKKYAGGWERGWFHGEGALWAANGAVYVGWFEAGQRQDAAATEVYADGST